MKTREVLTDFFTKYDTTKTDNLETPIQEASTPVKPRRDKDVNTDASPVQISNSCTSSPAQVKVLEMSHSQMTNILKEIKIKGAE